MTKKHNLNLIIVGSAPSRAAINIALSAHNAVNSDPFGITEFYADNFKSINQFSSVGLTTKFILRDRKLLNEIFDFTCLPEHQKKGYRKPTSLSRLQQRNEALSNV